MQALVRRELLLDADRRLAAAERLDVRREARAVAATDEPQRRDRPDADAEVVLAAPDRQVVTAPAIVAAVVRGLVPAIAGTLEPLDHVLVVILEQLGLARELGAVGEGEARPRLGLELVTGEVIGLERERRVDVAIECSPRLARDAEEHVEVQVGDAGATQRPHGAPHGLGCRPPLEHRELACAEALRPERDASAVSHEHLGERVVDRLGIGLHGDLPRGRQPGEQAVEQRRSDQRRRAAPDEDGVKRIAENRALPIKLREHGVDVCTVPVLVPRDRDEVAVAAAMRAEGNVDVQVQDRRHQTPPTWGIFARVRLSIPNSMDLRALRSLRRLDLSLSGRDLCLAGLLVSPIWLALGVLAGDLVMIVAAFAVAIVSILHFMPRLAASLRDASAALLPRSPLWRALPRALVLLRARA